MKFLRYPGGKGKFLNYLIKYLPAANDIKGQYIEPFVGGGSVFLHLKPENAIISDLNNELITLYKGIKLYPHKVWECFEKFPSGKKGYYTVRELDVSSNPLYYRAARTLYLNRTCFKGMWRHNTDGQFNVGYGGEERRWVITHENIIELSKILKRAEILNSDYSNVISGVSKNDFLFLDPPYKPGEKDLIEAHYINGKFSFEEQQRLADTLLSLPKKKNVKWAITNSSHKDIIKLYKNYTIRRIPTGTGTRPGILTTNSKEVLITNY
ncbi:MAG TPA: Dam family site-specific DNA-(adenine-N6)-methyltransferase [Flavipsychrobacter sp.]|nr:Dam family site-specific DNA-(adenine-N6)-methyltransferase [Flavipsychrobacter sp.]